MWRKIIIILLKLNDWAMYKEKKYGLQYTTLTISYLDSKPWSYASESHSFYMLIKDPLCQALCKGDAKLSSDAILLTFTSPMYTISRKIWYFLSMCFPLLWLHGSFAFAAAPLLSQYSVIADCTEGTTPISNRKFLSHTASFALLKLQCTHPLW